MNLELSIAAHDRIFSLHALKAPVFSSSDVMRIMRSLAGKHSAIPPLLSFFKITTRTRLSQLSRAHFRCASRSLKPGLFSVSKFRGLDSYTDELFSLAISSFHMVNTTVLPSKLLADQLHRGFAHTASKYAKASRRVHLSDIGCSLGLGSLRALTVCRPSTTAPAKDMLPIVGHHEILQFF
jgi:hypothetical protein